MITIRIGTDERDMTAAIDEQWIHQQLNGRRAAGEQVCVRVTVREADANVNLTTPTCGSGGSGRPPNATELEMIELWRKRGLTEPNFTGGNLVAFLKQLRAIVVS